MLHLLAIHQDIQAKLRQELLEHCPDGDLPHDELVALPYLDSVCRETLRLCGTILQFFLVLELIDRQVSSNSIHRSNVSDFPSRAMFTQPCLSARQDGQLPLLFPIQSSSGSQIDTVFVPKGTNIFVGLEATNTDPKIWGADALDWVPQRWLGQLPEEVSKAGIPGIYSNLYVICLLITPDCANMYSSH